MDASNLSIVFAPNILRPKIETTKTMTGDVKKVLFAVEFMIANHSKLCPKKHWSHYSCTRIEEKKDCKYVGPPHPYQQSANLKKKGLRYIISIKIDKLKELKCKGTKFNLQIEVNIGGNQGKTNIIKGSKTQETFDFSPDKNTDEPDFEYVFPLPPSVIELCLYNKKKNWEI